MANGFSEVHPHKRTEIAASHQVIDPAVGNVDQRLPDESQLKVPQGANETTVPKGGYATTGEIPGEYIGWSEMGQGH